jgi:hypothetical protein
VQRYITVYPQTVQVGLLLRAMRSTQASDASSCLLYTVRVWFGKNESTTFITSRRRDGSKCMPLMSTIFITIHIYKTTSRSEEERHEYIKRQSLRGWIEYWSKVRSAAINVSITIFSNSTRIRGKHLNYSPEG